MQKIGSLKTVAAAVLAALFMMPCLASAQGQFKGRFQLQKEVRWGKVALAPGNYTFKLESLPSTCLITIWSENRSRSAMVVPRGRDDAEPGGSFLTLTGEYGHQTIRSLNLPQVGASFNFTTHARTKRPSVAQVTAKTITVVTADN